MENATHTTSFSSQPPLPVYLHSWNDSLCHRTSQKKQQGFLEDNSVQPPTPALRIAKTCMLNYSNFSETMINNVPSMFSARKLSQKNLKIYRKNNLPKSVLWTKVREVICKKNIDLQFFPLLVTQAKLAMLEIGYNNVT